MFGEITDAFPGQPLLDRTSMNTWEDAAVIDEVNRIGKERIIFAGLWTSVCIVGPVASAIDQGFDVYFISDACGDISQEAHERAGGVQRHLPLNVEDGEVDGGRIANLALAEVDVATAAAGAEGGGYKCCQQRRYRPRRDAGCRLHQVLPAWVRMHLRLRHSAEVSPRVNVT